jgi:hypothetical protein
MKIEISAADLSIGTILGPLDAIAFALNLPTSADASENETVYGWSVDYWTQDARLTTRIIESANKHLTVEQMADLLDCDRDKVMGEYLAGDWAELEAPESFSRFVAGIKRELRENVSDFLYAGATLSLPEKMVDDLRESLEEALNASIENAVFEWKRDVSRVAVKYLGAKDVEYTPHTDTVSIVWEDDGLRDFFAYDLAEEEAIPSAEEVKAYFTECMQTLIDKREQAEERRREKRRQELEETKRRQEADKERKREEARRRKKELDKNAP